MGERELSCGAFASPSRGEEDAPRVSAARLLRRCTHALPKALTRSARQVGVISYRSLTPTPNARRLSSAVEIVIRGLLAELSRWRLALPPQGGGGALP